MLFIILKKKMKMNLSVILNIAVNIVSYRKMKKLLFSWKIVIAKKVRNLGRWEERFTLCAGYV